MYKSVGIKRKKGNKYRKQGYLWYFHAFYITINANHFLTLNTNGCLRVQSAPRRLQKASCLSTMMTARQHNQIL